MGEAQAEMAGMAEHLRSLHAPGTPGSQAGTIHLWPGSPFGRQPDPSMQFSILLIMFTSHLPPSIPQSGLVTFGVFGTLWWYFLGILARSLSRRS